MDTKRKREKLLQRHASEDKPPHYHQHWDYQKDCTISLFVLAAQCLVTFLGNSSFLTFRSRITSFSSSGKLKVAGKTKVGVKNGGRSACCNNNQIILALPVHSIEV